MNIDFFSLFLVAVYDNNTLQNILLLYHPLSNEIIEKYIT